MILKAEILKVLKNSNGYISGQQLCEHFQVSRTAVWKVIQKLQEEGYQIEAVRNKGYRIVETPDVVTEEEIKSLTQTSWAGKHVVFQKQVDSTNMLAGALAKEGCPNGTLAVAETQTKGRGRRGRVWSSPEGTSIYMSIVLKPDIAPEKAPMITLVAALATASAIREKTGLLAMIKWPNDIVLNGKKICGILTEMHSEMEYIRYVITGIGINVNTETFPGELKERATSLYLESGKKKWKRAELIAACMGKFEQYFEEFEAQGDLSTLQECYNEWLINRGREVKILDPENEYEAKATGINRTGELVVEKKTGEIKTVYAGEVSVRGIYGYI